MLKDPLIKRNVGRPKKEYELPTPASLRRGDKLEATLNSIGVSLDQVLFGPKFTDLLMRAKGGLEGVLEAMRFSNNHLIKEFLRVFDNHSKELQDVVPWEAWCIKAEIPVAELLGEIIFALREHSVNLIKIMSITYHPDSVWNRIQQAKTANGHKDREALDIALGFLPTPRGATIIGKYYESGSNLGVDPKPKVTAEEPKNVTPVPAPAPQTTLPPESQDPDDIEVEELFPDASRTARLLNG